MKYLPDVCSWQISSKPLCNMQTQKTKSQPQTHMSWLTQSHCQCPYYFVSLGPFSGARSTNCESSDRAELSVSRAQSIRSLEKDATKEHMHNTKSKTELRESVAYDKTEHSWGRFLTISCCRLLKKMNVSALLCGSSCSKRQWAKNPHKLHYIVPSTHP